MLNILWQSHECKSQAEQHGSVAGHVIKHGTSTTSMLVVYQHRSDAFRQTNQWGFSTITHRPQSDTPTPAHKAVAFHHTT